MTKSTAPRQRRSKANTMPGGTYAPTTEAMAAWSQRMLADVAGGMAYGRAHGPDRHSVEVAAWYFGDERQRQLVQHLVENITVLIIARDAIPVTQTLLDAVVDDVMHRSRRAVAVRTVHDRGLETGIGGPAYRLLLRAVEVVLGNVVRKGVEAVEKGLGVRAKNYAPASRQTHAIDTHPQESDVRTQVLTDTQKLDRIEALLGRPGLSKADRADLVISGIGITLRLMAAENALQTPAIESVGNH